MVQPAPHSRCHSQRQRQQQLACLEATPAAAVAVAVGVGLQQQRWGQVRAGHLAWADPPGWMMAQPPMARRRAQLVPLVLLLQVVVGWKGEAAWPAQHT
jgi:hypothetical protein